MGQEAVESSSVFAMIVKEEDPNAVILGKLLLENVYVHALFDSGATHPFVTPKVASQLSCVPVEMDYELCVSTPVGLAVSSDVMLKDCPIIINERKFPANLVRLEVTDFDVILGMDWLARHRVSVDCHKKEVSIKPLDGEELVYHGNGIRKPTPIISAMQARNFPRKGCQCYLCAVQQINPEEPKLDAIPVGDKFPEVFAKVPGLPPDREIEFTIDLVPGITSISKAPYRMAPVELAELKVQLQEMLDKGQIRPSVSPWGVPVLFVKKRMVASGYASITESLTR